MSRKLVIAIDFDGTIVEHKYPEIGKLRKNAKEVINKWYDNGHQIIIWTCRYLHKDLGACLKFLNDNGIKYHKVNENSDLMEWKPKPKIYYDVLIDDRNIGGIKEWDEVDKLLELL